MSKRAVFAALALIAFLGGLGWGVASSSTTAPVEPVAAITAPAEALPWTDDDFPIRVTTVEGGVRAEIKDYVDLDCQGCTDEFAVQEAQRIMSIVVAESLPVGEGLDVDEPTMPAYVSAILKDEGWTGVAGDGCVCLYPPTFTRPIAFI